MEKQTDRAAQVREKLESGDAWRRIKEDFAATGRAAPVLGGLSRAIDAIAVQAWQSSVAAAVSRPAAMLAVGAYGRGEVFPYSGVSVLIVHESDPDSLPRLKEAVSEFVRLLWEMGVRPDPRICAPGECLGMLGADLLDRRLLAGDTGLGATLESRIPEFLARNGQRLAQELCRLARARHAKYRNTPSHLEPDVNESPGGLRDLHLVASLAKLSVGQASRPVQPRLDEAAALLSSVGCFLHYRARDDRNVLDFEAQQAIHEQPFARAATSALWMRAYFKNARTVFDEARRALDACEQSGGSLIATFRDWQSRLSNAEFTVSHERLFLRKPAELESDPGMVFRLAEFVARHGIPPAAETERRMIAARDAFAASCAGPQTLWPALKTVFSLPHAAMALRMLRDTGLLTRIFPEWADIENLVAADPGRSYTVDEHSLMTVDRLGELRETTDPARQRFSQLLSEIEDPALLVFALLFREAGKGAGGEDALRTSAALARAAAARVRMTAGDLELVQFLIEHQPDLLDVVSGRDPDDPATARLLADRIGTVERLRSLAALTYAGIAAAHPDAMTPWRLEQLWRAYLVAQRELIRQLETERIRELPEGLSAQAGFIEGFPVRYLRTRTAAEIEGHAQLYQRSRPTGVAVELDRIEGAYRLTVVARDMPGLFASFAGAISSFGLNILKAEAFSNSKGLILDTFVFADPKRTLELNPPETERLQDLIRRVAAGKTDARRLLRTTPQPDPKKRAVAPRIQFDSQACETATLVEIETEDRPGLLYSLATVFSSAACNIDVVLIDTKGRRAIDVFYVSYEGGKPPAALQTTLEERLLAVC